MNEAGASADRLAPGAAVRHARHMSRSGSGDTRSPTSQPSTPSPSAAIRPTGSTPGTCGKLDRKPRDTLAHVDVEMVQRRGGDVDEDLARAGLGIRELFEPKNVGVPELVKDNRLHVPLLSPLVR